MPATPVTVAWKSYVEGYDDAATLPATLGTPAGAWQYGAATDLIKTDTAATVVVEAQALQGKIGFCLITPDHSALASEQKLLTPENGKTTVRLTFAAAKSPAHLLVRNYADGGSAGKVRIDSVAIETA